MYNGEAFLNSFEKGKQVVSLYPLWQARQLMSGDNIISNGFVEVMILGEGACVGFSFVGYIYTHTCIFKCQTALSQRWREEGVQWFMPCTALSGV